MAMTPGKNGFERVLNSRITGSLVLAAMAYCRTFTELGMEVELCINREDNRMFLNEGRELYIARLIK
jgi:hypothetical protein